MEAEIFSVRMKQARETKKIGLKEMREKLGVSQSAMSHYSTGSTLPPLEIAEKISIMLGVSLDWLCGRDEVGRFDYDTYGEIARALLGVSKHFNSACFSTRCDTDADDRYTFNETTLTIDDEKLSISLKRWVDTMICRVGTKASVNCLTLGWRSKQTRLTTRRCQKTMNCRGKEG